MTSGELLLTPLVAGMYVVKFLRVTPREKKTDVSMQIHYLYTLQRQAEDRTPYEKVCWYRKVAVPFIMHIATISVLCCLK